MRDAVRLDSMKILFIHAHFDDFEFTAAGTFQLWQPKPGQSLRKKVIICTDGKAGHHSRTREELGRVRLEEQKRSAAIGGYEFEPLRYSNGEIPREACLTVTTPLLAALWKAIRDFEPDYLFCPPLPTDPRAGLHIDHVAVAEAIRKVAYMINVPHAFTPEYPVDETSSLPCKVPVILTVYDGYMYGENSYDLAVDVEAAFGKIAEMSYCHQSQIMEWLPWVGRHSMAAPRSEAEWKTVLRDRFKKHLRGLHLPDDRVLEVFTVTAWGQVPNVAQLVEDFPTLRLDLTSMEALDRRLDQWRLR